MDTALWTACLLLGGIVVCGFYVLHKVFKPTHEAQMSELPQKTADTIFRHKLYYRFGALCCFLAAAVFLLLGDTKIACVVFVCMGFACQYGVYRLRCRFPVAAPLHQPSPKRR